MVKLTRIPQERHDVRDGDPAWSTLNEEERCIGRAVPKGTGSLETVYFQETGGSNRISKGGKDSR
jgi:hypothetical protein